MSSVTNNTNASGAAGTPGTTQSQQSLNNNYADFLQLLTTQLQNQDPTAPIDTNQLTQQIASLSQVQQEININSNLTNLIALYTSTQANTAVSYIGKQIDATGNQIELTNKSAAVVYNLPATAASATVTVTDGTGKTVFSGPGTTASGRNQLQWNGTANDGTAAPDGVYHFTVAAKDSKGNDLTATTYTTGVVTAVETANGVNSLSLGTLTVPLNSVQSVYNAGSNPGA